MSTPRNVLFAFPFATVLVAVWFWLGTAEAEGAQFSVGNSWPEVEWGMPPTAAGTEGRSGQPAPILADDGLPVALTLGFAQGNVVMRFRADKDSSLGPAVGIDALSTVEEEKDGSVESKHEPDALRLGNVGFKQAADSFNVGKSEIEKAGDLSRQFGGAGIASKDVVTATPVSGWAIGGIAALAVVAALAIGFFENDRDDRHRRKKSRTHRRRHSS